jgi:phosphoserine phosphatase
MTEEFPKGAREKAPSVSLETKLWRLAEIISAARRIHSSLTLDRVLDLFLDIAVGEVGATGGSLYLLDAAAETLLLERSRWAGEMSDSQRQHCANLAREAAMLGEMTEKVSQSGLGAIISLPLRDESKAGIGVLQIFQDDVAILDGSDRLFLTELSHFASLSIRNAQYHEDSLAKANLDSEIGLARDIQMGTLPREMPQVAGYDVAGLSRPADETSGDSFDLFASGSSDLTILLADATGHGIGPALSVTQVRSMLRVAVRLETDLDDILRNINDQLCDDLASNRFVTAFFGQLEAGTHQLRYHSAGQGPLILYRAATGESQMFGGTCPPLGLLPMRVVSAPQVIGFEPGDTFALVTDGVFEAENADEQMLEEEAVMKIIRETSHMSCAESARQILARVDEHRGEALQADDITIVLIRRND